jgi:hypothetical protein
MRNKYDTFVSAGVLIDVLDTHFNGCRADFWYFLSIKRGREVNVGPSG